MFEQEGPRLEQQEVTFEQPGEHEVFVRARDSNGRVVGNSLTIRVLPRDASDQELLETIDISVGSRIDGCARIKCFRIRSDLELTLDEAVFETKHAGAPAQVHDRISNLQLGREAVELCDRFDANEEGQLALTLELGDAERNEREDIRDASGLCP